MGWQYDNLSNEELQRIAVARFGCALRSLSEIGRQAVIEELQANDNDSKLNQVESTLHVTRGKQ